MRATPPTGQIDAYIAKVREFHDTAGVIEATSEDDELFLLLRSTAAPPRRRCAPRREVRDALIEYVVDEARAQNEERIARYEAMPRRIDEKPTDEAELQALKDFIDAANAEILRIVDDSVAHAEGSPRRCARA